MMSGFKGNDTFESPSDAAILAATAPVAPDSGCIPDVSTLCLGDEGRFQARLDWRHGLLGVSSG